MEDVASVLGKPDRTHMVTVDQEVLTSWIYHTSPEPMCVWFDGTDMVKLASRNCLPPAAEPHV